MELIYLIKNMLNNLSSYGINEFAITLYYKDLLIKFNTSSISCNNIFNKSVNTLDNDEITQKITEKI